ncbi:NADPH:quinone reductase [Luteimicrobium sp. NPDC057192]|uniref:NADPH:quinone reductase n=1 Tax=Luteimicrobium sp. NPDC057192 TaxID=3346042 RepID=UPI00363C4314
MTALPDRMHAAFVDHPGPAESIRYDTLPVPTPGPTDALVRVEAVAVNHVDTFVRSGAYATPLPSPFVVGRDLVGTVVACGPGVPGFAVGDRVWTNSLGHAGRQGAAAEYAAVPADRLYHAPDHVAPAELVAVLHPAATAFLAVELHGAVRPGETVLVAGAAGHVGRAAVLLAARAGARVVATARAEDADVVRALGADAVVDYRSLDLAARLRTAAPDGVDVHVDTSGQHDLDLAVGLMAPRGRVVLLAGMRARPELPVGPVYTHDLQLRGFAISVATVDELAAAARRINLLVADDALRPRAVEELPLAGAAEAHRRLEAGEARGTRLVLLP